MIAENGDRRVRITSLKEFALDRLSQGLPLRDLLLSEPDELSPNEFLVKCEVWLKLLKRSGWERNGISR